ncbi:metallophosphoesterase [Rhizobium sp. ZK1]|uniref:metallophosphoesterase n=1 Tax=Rhizobium sp. ZK1 TaxID=3389872 RepID=UPI0039F65C9E
MLVAQISDIHAGPDSPSLLIFERAIDWLKAFRPDALVLTGDLVDNGWREGYRRMAQSLRSLDFPVYLLPGNGDDQPVMRGELAGIGNWAGTSVPMHFHAALTGVTLVGIDVTVAGQSYGDILPHLPWLGSTLADAATPVLVFLHQPPFEIGIEVLDQVGCKNGDALLALLKAMERPPLGILCGHVHRAVLGRTGSLALQTCGSLCPPNPLLLGDRGDLPVLDASSFLLHEVRNDRLLSHIVSIQSLAEGG